MANIVDLIQRARTIRIETKSKKNTADRIGSLLLDIARGLDEAQVLKKAQYGGIVATSADVVSDYAAKGYSGPYFYLVGSSLSSLVVYQYAGSGTPAQAFGGAAYNFADYSEVLRRVDLLGPKIDEQINPFSEIPSDSISNRFGNVFKATATSPFVTNGHWYLYRSSSNSSMTGKSNSCKYNLVSVKEGDRYIVTPVNGVAPHAPRVIFLTEVPEYVTNTYIDITDKIIDSILSISEETTLTVPANAVCMYVEQEFAAYNDSSATNIAPTCIWQDSGYNLHDDIETVKAQLATDSERINTLQDDMVETSSTCVEVAMPHYSGKKLYKGDSASARDGMWYKSTPYNYTLIPVNGGDTFKIIAGTKMCIYAWLINDAEGAETIIGNAKFYPANYADGESMQTISANMTKVIVAPSDARYLYVFQGDNANRASTPSFVGIRRSWEDSVNKGVGTDILDFHPDAKMLDLMKTMAFKGKTNVRSNVWGCFVFGHITDCHGRDNEAYSQLSWERFVRFCRYYKEKNERFIADMVDTGDIVADSAAVSGTEVTMNWRTEGRDVLIALGNHDVADKISGVLKYERMGQLAYNQFLHDKISQWNVVQPTDAETNGYCYYYKDYEIGGGETSSTTPTPHGLRAIFIDAMDWLTDGAASLDYHQAAFVKSALDGALSEGRHVIIFAHEWPGSMVNFDCTWNESPYQMYNQDIADSNSKVANDSIYNYLAYLVAKFQSSGGGFAGYVCGHHHVGYIGRKTGTCTFDDETVDFDNGTPQLVICGHYGRVSNSVYPGSGGGNLAWTGINTINQDCFRIISIDTTNNIVKLMQIGKELDYALKAKGLLSIRYTTYQPFDETVTTYARNSIVARDGFLWRILTPAYKDVEVEGVMRTHTDWDNTIKVMYNRVFNQ